MTRAEIKVLFTLCLVTFSFLTEVKPTGYTTKRSGLNVVGNIWNNVSNLHNKQEQIRKDESFFIHVNAEMKCYVYLEADQVIDIREHCHTKQLKGTETQRKTIIGENNTQQQNNFYRANRL